MENWDQKVVCQNASKHTTDVGQHHEGSFDDVCFAGGAESFV